MKNLRKVAALLLAFALLLSTGATTIFAEEGKDAPEEEKAVEEKLSEEKAEEEKAVEEKEVEEKEVEEKEVEEKEVEEKPSEEKAEEKKPAEDKQEKTVEEKPSEKKAKEEKPSEDKQEKDQLEKIKVQALERLKIRYDKGKYRYDKYEYYSSEIKESKTVEDVKRTLEYVGIDLDKPEKEPSPFEKKKMEALKKLRKLRDHKIIGEEFYYDLEFDIRDSYKVEHLKEAVETIDQILSEHGLGEKPADKKNSDKKASVKKSSNKKTNANKLTGNKPAVNKQAGSVNKQQRPVNNNPKTGDAGIALSAITLLSSAGAYVFTSRKKDQ